MIKNNQIIARAWMKEGYSLKNASYDEFTIRDLMTGKYDFSQYKNWNLCTGMIDRNGINIYEGDILKMMWQHDGVRCYDYEVIGDVFYKIDEGRFMVSCETEDSISELPLHSFEREEILPENIEVLGNIYENPELLELNL